MDITESAFAPLKEEDDVVSHEIADNDLNIVKEEPRELDFSIKCEMCNKNCDIEIECIHFQNDRLRNLEPKQEDKLHSADGLQTNSSSEDVKPKVENSECSPAQEQEDSIFKLINPEVSVEQDSPEYLSTKMDYVECETGLVKTEVDNIFHENIKTESVKIEPTDYEASLSSEVFLKEEDSDEKMQPSSSSAARQDFGTKLCRQRSVGLVALGRTRTREKTHTCKVCSTSFRYASHLTVHGRIHTGEKPFVCRVCAKAFSHRYNLLTHEKIHTEEKRFQCKTCLKSFIQRKGLVDHERTHTGEKPFSCEVCSKVFANTSNLASHKRIHSGKKSFCCTVCSKVFTEKSHLTGHERIHTEEKPFSCLVCSKPFARQSYLIRHNKTHTRKKPHYE